MNRSEAESLLVSYSLSERASPHSVKINVYYSKRLFFISISFSFTLRLLSRLPTFSTGFIEISHRTLPLIDCERKGGGVKFAAITAPTIKEMKGSCK